MKIDFSHAQSITPKLTQQIVEKLEATFWAEMLKTSKAFDGAFGGDDMGHYRSFMIEAQAEQLAKHAPLGLGDIIMSGLANSVREEEAK